VGTVGIKTVGIKDVARRAGVSQGTVSNVLNRPDKVAAPTRSRVEAAIRELGFVRHASASNLRSGRSRAIGLVVLDISNPFFAELARGVEDAASAAGYSVILCNSADDTDRESRHLVVLAEQRVQGVLLTPITGSPTIGRMREYGGSVVLVDHPAQRPDLCSVAVDDVAGGRMAVTHLIERGARRIAVVNGATTMRQCADRQRGARLAVSGTDALLEEIDAGRLHLDTGEQAGEELLRSGPLPDAIFCTNDLGALGVLRALLRAGVRLPDDVRLIGYDDIGLTAAAAVPLSSIRQPAYQLGKVATELLLAETDSPAEHAHQQIMFQPTLTVRESTA
jgi:LacI family transcriptional regulator